MYTHAQQYDIIHETRTSKLAHADRSEGYTGAPSNPALADRSEGKSTPTIYRAQHMLIGVRGGGSPFLTIFQMFLVWILWGAESGPGRAREVFKELPGCHSFVLTE